jgi:hypothetical protein
MYTSCNFSSGTLSLHLLRSSSASDDLHQLSCNDGLTGSIIENRVPADHVSSVLRGVLAVPGQHCG